MAQGGRDSKDPMPTADNSQRQNGGNVKAVGEKKGQRKSEFIKGDRRFSSSLPGPDQPGRQKGDGNCVATGELHGQKKAEKITGAQRGGENTGGNLTYSPGR